MLNLFTTVAPHRSTVLAGNDESYAALLIVQLACDALRHGFDVVEIVDAPDDSAKDRVAAWVRYFNLDPAILKHFYTIDKGWTFADAKALAVAINDATEPSHLARPIFAYHIASALQTPQWLPLAKAAVAHMDDTSSIVTAATWGSTLMPTPRLADWPADRLWHIRSTHHMQVSLANIATAETLKFHGEVYGPNKVMLFKQVEAHHV